DVGDGMALAAADVAARALGVAPVGARRPAPPVAEVAQVDRAAGLAEDERAGDERVVVGVRVVLPERRPLRPRRVPGRLHAPPELGHRDGMAVDPEAVDGDLADRPLLWVEAVRAHAERAPGQLDHVAGLR